MSKFLLNLLVQISKALVYSKIKFYSKKNFSVAFGQQRPIFFSFPPASPPSPLGLGLSASPSRPLGPADRAPVVPYRIAASHTERQLQPCRLCPLRARLTGGPHLSSLTSGSKRAQPRRHRLLPLPAPPSTTPSRCRPSRYSPTITSPS
jgi:hypothetical protein